MSFARCAAGSPIFAGETSFAPAACPRHGKRRGHRKGEAKRSGPPFAGLTAIAVPRGTRSWPDAEVSSRLSVLPGRSRERKRAEGVLVTGL
jgi:hypothetical protein